MVGIEQKIKRGRGTRRGINIYQKCWENFRQHFLREHSPPRADTRKITVSTPLGSDGLTAYPIMAEGHSTYRDDTEKEADMGDITQPGEANRSTSAT